uniref:Pentatricopeptide repeat-containing protein n=1 Tax=Peronospora matthiolae TaxID=2874970 RepID=A0AAV1T0V5_9STRA
MQSQNLLRRCCQCTGPCAAASTRSVLFPRFGAASARAVASQPDAAEKTLRSPNQLNVLLSNQTPPTTFVATCRALRAIDETALLVTIDVRTWNVALQRRPEAQGERCDDSVFLRGFRTDEMQELLRQLKRRYGPQFVARVLVTVVNGCANIKMFADAHELLLYQQTLWSEIRSGTTTTDETLTTGWSEKSKAMMPPSVVGHLMAKMMHKKKHGQVLAFAPCMEIEDFSTFKDVFRRMVARGVARSAGFGSAIRYCHMQLDPTFLEEVLDEAGSSQGTFLAHAEQLVDSARHITMLEMVESQCNASIGEVFNLMNVFLEWKLTSNIQVFTSLLSIYMRRREVGNAVALIGAMEEHGVVQHVKASTTVAFIMHLAVT